MQPGAATVAVIKLFLLLLLLLLVLLLLLLVTQPSLLNSCHHECAMSQQLPYVPRNDLLKLLPLSTVPAIAAADAEIIS